MTEIRMSQVHDRVPVTVMSLTGAADASSASEIRTRAEAAITAGARKLIIDLSETPYVSLAGLVAIDHIHELLIAAQYREESSATLEGIRTGTCRSSHLKLVNPPLSMLHALRARGLDTYIEIHHNLKDAIASFGPGAPRRQGEENPTALE